MYDTNAKKRGDVEEDASLVTSLTYLGYQDDARKELVKYGSIKDDRLKKKADLFKLLLTYGEDVAKEKLVYDGKHFQLYVLPRNGEYLLGIKPIMGRIFSETKKDVFFAFEREDKIGIKGLTKLTAEKIFSEIGKRFNCEFYSHKNSGGCILDKEKFPDVLNFLKELYEE